MPIILAIILVLVAWNMPPPDFPHDSPRELPWSLPDYKQAKTGYHTLSDGRLAVSIEHLPMPGVTPEMVAWFYQVLPISTVELNGKEYPLYHLFHPSEHGLIEITEPASSGSEGMGVGALVSRREWFGHYNSEGSGRITTFGSGGITFVPEFAGMQLGSIEHRFVATPCGTQYTVTSVLGSELPLLGPLINQYIRHRKFPPEMMADWLRHQVQEVSSLPFFLPALYAQRANVPSTSSYQLSAGDIVNVRPCAVSGAQSLR